MNQKDIIIKHENQSYSYALSQVLSTLKGSTANLKQSKY
ncbi:unnamed protein product [Paramecium sonneborni]|uniref:Uncharacterized protein n=1 Tax=Paramecium sonneborni TaxID=65129 RepID=A0A8S1R9A5_9CILI|nr:unnamed protein product [Paramecium sonneborni]